MVRKVCWQITTHWLLERLGICWKKNVKSKRFKSFDHPSNRNVNELYIRGETGVVSLICYFQDEKGAFKITAILKMLDLFFVTGDLLYLTNISRNNLQRDLALICNYSTRMSVFPFFLMFCNFYFYGGTLDVRWLKSHICQNPSDKIHFGGGGGAERSGLFSLPCSPPFIKGQQHQGS